MLCATTGQAVCGQRKQLVGEKISVDGVKRGVKGAQQSPGISLSDKFDLPIARRLV